MCFDFTAYHSTKEGELFDNSYLGEENVGDSSGQHESAGVCCSVVDSNKTIEEKFVHNELPIDEAVAEKLILILQSRLQSFCHSLLKLVSSSGKM